ncbi:MAG: glycosyltransferase family 4 protein [Bacteroidia bacterium]
MKICHLTSVHKWNDVRIFEKECVSAAAAGFDVTLVAVNADEGVHRKVKVVSVPAQQGGRLKRMLGTVNAVYEKALEVNADVYHFHDPELLRISDKLLRKGKKVIYDSHEDLPRQILDKTWIKPFLRKIISAAVEYYENKKASRLTAVVAATPHIQQRFLKVNRKVVNVNNFPVLELIPHNRDWSSRKNEICYIGGIFYSRGAVELIDALEKTNTRLNLAGNYSPESLRNVLISKKGWEKVNEYGFVGREDVGKILSVSKVGIVTLHPTKAYVDSLPIKLFEYMAAGIPVVASDFPLWRSIVEKHNCGLLVDPLNPDAIAQAINAILSDDEKARQMGENGRVAALAEYSWSAEAEKLCQLYSNL